MCWGERLYCKDAKPQKKKPEAWPLSSLPLPSDIPQFLLFFLLNDRQPPN